MACRKAFVTGGGGYVGSSLCRQLLERGYTVVTFDLRYPEEDQDDGIHRFKVSLARHTLQSPRIEGCDERD